MDEERKIKLIVFGIIILIISSIIIYGVYFWESPNDKIRNTFCIEQGHLKSTDYKNAGFLINSMKNIQIECDNNIVYSELIFHEAITSNVCIESDKWSDCIKTNYTVIKNYRFTTNEVILN